MKRKAMKPNPASVFPDDAADQRGMSDAEALGYLTLRRFFVATVQLGDQAPESVIALSPHYATSEQAHEQVPTFREYWPHCGVISCILAFDPADPAHMERFERMRTEGEASQRGPLQ